MNFNLNHENYENKSDTRIFIVITKLNDLFDALTPQNMIFSRDSMFIDSRSKFQGHQYL